MGFISTLLSSGGDRSPEEKAVDVMQHQAYHAASNQAARNLRSECIATHQLNEAVIETEQRVPWWRR